MEHDERPLQRRPKMRTPPPGPNSKALVDRDTAVLATSTKTSPIAVKRASGLYVEDLDGNLLIDFTSGIGVLNTGHCHPKVVNAIRKQVGDLMHFAGTDFYYESQVELAEVLTKLTPGEFSKRVFFTNSGTESNEAAIKVIQWATKRPKLLAFIGAFHGRTMGSLGLTASKPVQKGRFLYHMAGVEHVPYANCYRCPYKLSYPDCDVWCMRIIEEVYLNTFIPPEDIGGVFMEPVQGEGGYVVPPRKAIAQLRKICDKFNLIMVDDEVQAGFGRTGKMFGIEHHGVIPEIVVMAKGMGSGMPIGACVFDAKYDWGVEGAHSNTYGGNPVGCVASLATIEVIKEENLTENATKVGDVLAKRLLEFQNTYPGMDNARGLGLMRAIEFVRDKESKIPDSKTRDRVIEKAYKNGLVLLPCGASSIRFIPPLIITKDQMNVAMDVFSETLEEVMTTKEPSKVSRSRDDKEHKIVLPPFRSHDDLVEGQDTPRTEGLKPKKGKADAKPKKAGKKKR